MALKDLITKIRITAKDETTAVFSSLQKRVAGIATAIAGYFSARMFGDSVRSAEDLDVQMRKLEATITATGGAAGLTAKDIDDMARRLDEATLGSAAGFRAAANSLLTFKSIGKDSFETVLSLAADLEAAGFGSLEANAIQLGKALENPTKGLTALTRSGVTFSDEQEKVIKALVKTGQTAEAQGIILEAVAGQVGGVAAAAGGGLSGIRDLINKLKTDIQEAFGKELLPALEKLGQKAADFLRTLRDSGAVESIGRGFAFVAEKADKLAKILIFVLGVRAVNALRALTMSATAATGALGVKTVAVGLATGALNLMAAAGARATAAMIALTRASPILAIGAGLAWLGSKLLEARKTSEEAVEAVEEGSKEVTKAIDESVTSAEALRFKLSEVQDKFMELTREGKGAGEALKSILSGADLNMSDGIAKALNDLQLLQDSALATGQQIQEGLTDRLSKLGGKELREFGIQAEMAFGRGEIGAEQLATALEARTIAAAKRLGVQLELSADGMSSAFRDAAESLDLVAGAYDDIRAAGADAGTVLEQSITAALRAASSPRELEHLADVIRQAGENGQIAQQQVGRFLDEIGKKTDQVTPGINSLAEALKALGVTSDQELAKAASDAKATFDAAVQMGASLRERREAFNAYARAAIAANNGIADAALKAQASVLGLALESTSTGDRIATGLASGDQALQDMGNQAERTRRAIESIGDEAERTGERIAKSMRPFGGESGFNVAADDFGSSVWGGASRIGGTTGALERELRAAATAAGGRR